MQTPTSANTKLAVNEVFETIQGEATMTGSPAVFVRLQGCDVGCPFCDTKHTWTLDPAKVRPLGEIAFEKVVEGPTYALADEAELLSALMQFRARHVVITGGEPAAYDLRLLSLSLKSTGRTVQLETSGTEAIRICDDAFVTVSPKIGMPGGKTILPTALMRANEIKAVVGKPADVLKLRELLEENRSVLRRDVSIWVQPLSQSAKATRLCIEAATQYGWRVSIQTHRFIGVR